MADDPLIEETLSHLLGFTLDQGQLTWLTADIEDDDLALTVADPNAVSGGVLEVGEELVYAASSDIDGVTLAPFGRGYGNTTPAAWTSLTRVSMAPRFPRARIREAINGVILGTYPRLFAVDEEELTPDPSRITYELPAEVEQVLTVRQQTIGPYGYWRPIHSYTSRDASTTEYATGKSIDIIDPLHPSQPVHVRYTKKPLTLAAGDPFTDSGLADTAWPCVMYGALHRLLAAAPAGLAGTESVQSSEAQTRRRVSLAEVAREYYALHAQLLLEERDRLFAEHDATSNFQE
jgi:hypothetical protein